MRVGKERGEYVGSMEASCIVRDLLVLVSLYTTVDRPSNYAERRRIIIYCLPDPIRVPLIPV
jgi:hypothetical protein